MAADNVNDEKRCDRLSVRHKSVQGLRQAIDDRRQNVGSVADALLNQYKTAALSDMTSHKDESEEQCAYGRTKEYKNVTLLAIDLARRRSHDTCTLQDIERRNETFCLLRCGETRLKRLPSVRLETRLTDIKLANMNKQAATKKQINEHTKVRTCGHQKTMRGHN